MTFGRLPCISVLRVMNNKNEPTRFFKADHFGYYTNSEIYFDDHTHSGALCHSLIFTSLGSFHSLVVVEFNPFQPQKILLASTCVCVCMCVCVCTHVLVTQPCLTLCDPIGCSLTRFLHPWDFPGKNNGVGCHFHLKVNIMAVIHVARIADFSLLRSFIFSDLVTLAIL